MRAIIAYALLMVMLAGGMACKSPAHTAYVTIGSVGTTADAAIGAYSEYILYNEVPPDQIRSVRRAVQAYISAVEIARASAISYEQGNLNRKSLDHALAAMEAASAEVINLILIFTTPQPAPFNTQPNP